MNTYNTLSYIVFLYLFIYFYFFFETECYTAQAGFELALSLRVPLNDWLFFFYLLAAGLICLCLLIFNGAFYSESFKFNEAQQSIFPLSFMLIMDLVRGKLFPPWWIFTTHVLNQYSTTLVCALTTTVNSRSHVVNQSHFKQPQGRQVRFNNSHSDYWLHCYFYGPWILLLVCGTWRMTAHVCLASSIHACVSWHGNHSWKEMLI